MLVYSVHKTLQDLTSAAVVACTVAGVSSLHAPWCLAQEEFVRVNPLILISPVLIADQRMSD